MTFISRIWEMVILDIIKWPLIQKIRDQTTMRFLNHNDRYHRKLGVIIKVPDVFQNNR